MSKQRIGVSVRARRNTNVANGFLAEVNVESEQVVSAAPALQWAVSMTLTELLAELDKNYEQVRTFMLKG